MKENEVAKRDNSQAQHTSQLQAACPQEAKN